MAPEGVTTAWVGVFTGGGVSLSCCWGGAFFFSRAAFSASRRSFTVGESVMLFMNIFFCYNTRVSETRTSPEFSLNWEELRICNTALGPCFTM